MLLSTGMIRPVDKLGRVVIPKELRRRFDVKNDVDSFEIFVDDDKIVLKKYQPCCVFCHSLDNCIPFKDRLVCKDCIDKLSFASISENQTINIEDDTEL